MGATPRLVIGDNADADATIASHAGAMKTAQATMERKTLADRPRGALSHPGTVVLYVDVG